MDYLTRRATRHKTMAAQGVWSGQLSYVHGTGNGWKLEFSYASHLTREAAKQIASEYLHDEFDAWGVSFFVSKIGKHGTFYAKFYSNAL